MPSWLTPERRQYPTEEDFQALLRQHTYEISTKLDHTAHIAKSNCADLQDLEVRFQVLQTKFAEHKIATTEVLESFKFSRRLKRFFWGTLAGIIMLATVFFQFKDLEAYL